MSLGQQIAVAQRDDSTPKQCKLGPAILEIGARSVMKNLFEVLREKENQVKELHAEIKRVEEQIEKLRAAASILSEDVERAPQFTVTAPEPQAASEQGAAAAAASGAAKNTKRWLP